MENSLLVFLLLFLLFWSAFFSGSEAALFSLQAARLKVYQTEQDPKKRTIASLLKHPRDLLVTIFMLNTLVNILMQNTAANIFGDRSSWLLKVGVPLVLTLIFGELIPKYIGLQYSIPFSYKVAPLIDFFTRIFKPIRQAIIFVTTPLSRLLFFFLRPEEPMSTEEIKHLLKSSKQSGIFTADDEELLGGYIKLQEASVKEVMWPREDILFYSLQEPLTKLAYLFIDQECSRIPICKGSLDEVVGVISAMHYLVHRHQLNKPDDLLPLLAKPFYVPETTPARLLLRRFNEQRQLFALVVDEYGSISGLITREDLIEVVVGEISDRRDQKNLYTLSGKNEIIASGKLELEEFNELFQSNLISPENMVTIGGWLIERLGEIPKSGTKTEQEGFLFQILAATPNRIRRLYIRKLDRKERHK